MPCVRSVARQPGLQRTVLHTWLEAGSRQLAKRSAPGAPNRIHLPGIRARKRVVAGRCVYSAVKEEEPDFQRPAGNYDSWYIRDAQSGEYLRGFESWDRV